MKLILYFSAEKGKTAKIAQDFAKKQRDIYDKRHRKDGRKIKTVFEWSRNCRCQKSEVGRRDLIPIVRHMKRLTGIYKQLQGCSVCFVHREV